MSSGPLVGLRSSAEHGEVTKHKRQGDERLASGRKALGGPQWREKNWRFGPSHLLASARATGAALAEIAAQWAARR